MTCGGGDILLIIICISDKTPYIRGYIQVCDGKLGAIPRGKGKGMRERSPPVWMVQYHNQVLLCQIGCIYVLIDNLNLIYDIFKPDI